jgi:acetylornithine deacetylase/succinyl-diaminopimelate desuccinylase-like protein
MNMQALKDLIATLWDRSVLPALCDYIRIPCISPMFDSEWKSHGHMEAAVTLFETWAREKIKKLPGAALEVVRAPGRTPLILIDVPGKTPGTVLLYGHLDKQPEATGWSEGLGPWTPVIRDDKLYGRGSVDDGYAMFAALSALLALEEQKLPHARCLITIEAAEESSSPDMPFYVEHIAKKIGAPGLVICLDSGCGTYDRLWLTTSLRGTASGKLTARVLNEGVHSGTASGIVPSSFRILRMLLSRIEEEATGEIKLKDAFVEIPPDRLEQADATARILGKTVFTELPFAGGTKPMGKTPVEMLLNRTWRPQLAVTGIDGYPKPEVAGNVLLPYSTAKLSMRTPPGCDADALVRTLKEVLEKDPPYGAEVSFAAEEGHPGWNAPAFAPWLEAALVRASSTHFGNPVAFMGIGGSISFMGLLAKKFPNAQFVVTGVSGPDSHAHGPDEFLDIPAAKKLSACVAEILAAQATK